MGVYKLSGAGGLLTPRVNYTSMLAGNEAYVEPGDYELISTTLFSGSTSSVTFDVSTLASTYKHLQIRVVGRTLRAAGTDTIGLRFNSDSGSNYNGHYLFADGSTVVSGSFSNTYVNASDTLGNSVDTTNFVLPAVIDLLDVFSNTKNKTVRTLEGVHATPKFVAILSNLWRNTNTVTSIEAFVVSGSNFTSNSRISLYGIKG